MLLTPIKKYRYLRATHRAMKVYTKRLGYTYVTPKGANGHHRTDGDAIKEIIVGRDQSLEDRVIILAHELGHAMDFTHNPMTLQECMDNMDGTITASRVAREVIAWEYGKTLLTDMKCFHYVQERFIEYKRIALGGYRKARVRVQVINK